jgi:leucyl aminopeptidase
MSHECLENLIQKARSPVPLTVLEPAEYSGWLAPQDERVRRWIKALGFEARAGKHCLVPGDDGSLARVVAIVSERQRPWACAALPAALPAGDYAVQGELSEAAAERIAFDWALGTYRFERYKKRPRSFARLVWPRQAARERVASRVEAVALCRDLINTPANDLGPLELVEAGRSLAKRHRARSKLVVGERLIRENFPMIHAVGRASSRPPALLEFTWGSPSHPKLTLVGKGVCFDSGGLDLKPAEYMKLMKKDMGGAAAALGLAHIVMSDGLPVRLKVLIPAAENSVSGNAFRPLDVIRTRKGLTVEVGNTDAEGRLILCDALAAADAEKPDLIVDLATLTGAARVALGTALPALFCNDDALAEQVLASGRDSGDPLWRLPLHAAYKKQLSSQVADLNNIGGSAFAGAITAALFLKEFVSEKTPWVHVDTMGWNLESEPGRPVGGEAFAVIALAEALRRRFAVGEAARARRGKPRAKRRRKARTERGVGGRSGKR